MTCEAIHAFGSWPILVVVIWVSFGLGAFWHSKHAADLKRRHPERRKVRVGTAVNTAIRDTDQRDLDTTYCKGRRSGDGVPFPRTEIPAGGTRGRQLTGRSTNCLESSRQPGRLAPNFRR